MSDANMRAEQYHRQFKNAQTDKERQLLVLEYKAYYNQLSDQDKAEADKVHDAYWAETRQRIEEMEPVLQRAKEQLSRYEQPARFS